MESHSKNEGSQLIPRVCFLGPNPSNHSAFLAHTIQRSSGDREVWMAVLFDEKEAEADFA